VPQFRDQYLEQPHRRRLSPDDTHFAEIMSRHSDAVSKGEPCYIDPTTGLSVFTAASLADRGYCCDSGCRHCPYIVD
jgi:hypothetical protein